MPAASRARLFKAVIFHKPGMGPFNGIATSRPVSGVDRWFMGGYSLGRGLGPWSKPIRRPAAFAKLSQNYLWLYDLKGKTGEWGRGLIGGIHSD
jgi:hypothetical protein